MELEEQLDAAEAVEARLPGRAIQLHEKLSSPARKKEPHETFKHYQEKQDKARLRRQMFSEEKAIKLAQLNQVSTPFFFVFDHSKLLKNDKVIQDFSLFSSFELF